MIVSNGNMDITRDSAFYNEHRFKMERNKLVTFYDNKRLLKFLIQLFTY